MVKETDSLLLLSSALVLHLGESLSALLFDVVSGFRKSGLCVHGLKSRVDVLDVARKAYEKRQASVLEDQYMFADVADTIDGASSQKLVILESVVKLALGAYKHEHYGLLVKLLAAYFFAEGVAYSVNDIEKTLKEKGVKVRRFHADPRNLYIAARNLTAKFLGRGWEAFVEEVAGGKGVRQAVEEAITSVIRSTTDCIVDYNKKYAS